MEKFNKILLSLTLIISALALFSCNGLKNNIDEDSAIDDDFIADSDALDLIDEDNNLTEKPGFYKLNLKLSADFSEVLGFGEYDVAYGIERSWVSAYTIQGEPGNTVNGPMALWERSKNDDFIPAEIPSSNFVWFPEICAVDDNEVYITISEWIEKDQITSARIFARQTGEKPVFTDQEIPEFEKGLGVMSMKSACFSQGNLWVFGHTQIGDDLYSSKPYLFHRRSTAESWEKIAVPDEEDVASWGTGLTAVLINVDGTGFYAFSRGEIITIYDRKSDGSWQKVFHDSTSVAQVTDFSANNDRSQIIATYQSLAETGGFLKYENGEFLINTVKNTSQLWTSSTGSDDKIYIGGYLEQESELTLSMKTVFLTSDKKEALPFRDGRIQHLELSRKSKKGLAIIDYTEIPEETGLHEIIWE